MRQKLRSILRRNSIQWKLLAAVSVLIFASSILIICLGHIRFTYDYSKQAAEDMQQLIEQVSLNVDAYLDELVRLCLSPYYSSRVMDQLESKAVTGQEFLDKRRDIENYLRQVMITPRKDVLRVYIFSDAVYSCARTVHSSVPETYRQEPWFQEAMATDEYVYLPADTENQGSSAYMVFSFAKRLCSLKDNKETVGVIRVDANYNGIKAVCDRVAISPNGTLLITDAAGNWIYSNSKLPKDISAAQILSASPDSGYLTRTLNHTAYILNAQTVSTTGWRVIAVNSQSEITKSAKETLLFNMILAMVLAGAGVVVSAYYVKKLLKPLYQTVTLMNQVQAGNLDVRASTQATDEIAYLNSAFNRMLEQIQDMLLQETRLTKQVYEAKYLQKQAQFDALYHQIQPHFLFNTLNTISLLIKCGRNADAISGIDQLAVLLRGMANANREIDLKSELKITESYLHLQKLRHDALTYEIQAQDVDLSYLLPALTIQPLVENALIHGCEAKSGEIVIRICLTTQDDYLSVCVQDNGIGMEPEALRALQAKLDQCDDEDLERSNAQGIGLVNIQRRIHLKFGSEYGIHMISKAGAGTTVTLLLPRRESYVHCIGR